MAYRIFDLFIQFLKHEWYLLAKLTSRDQCNSHYQDSASSLVDQWIAVIEKPHIYRNILLHRYAHTPLPQFFVTLLDTGILNGIDLNGSPYARVSGNYLVVPDPAMNTTDMKKFASGYALTAWWIHPVLQACSPFFQTTKANADRIKAQSQTFFLLPRFTKASYPPELSTRTKPLDLYEYGNGTHYLHSLRDLRKHDAYELAELHHAVCAMIADLCGVSPDDNRIVCHFNYPPAEAFSTLHVNVWYNLPRKYPVVGREHMLTTVIEQLELHGEYRPGEFYLKTNWHMLDQIYRMQGCVSKQWFWSHLRYREKSIVIPINTNTSDIPLLKLHRAETCQWFIRVIDPVYDNDIAHQIAALLTGSTEEYKESLGGHVPDWVVKDIIHRRYTSIEAVQQTFATTGVRFALLQDKIEKKNADLLATILVARHPDMLFIKDSQTLNISLSSDSIEMPLGYHHCINFVTNMAYRSSGFGRTLLQHIIDHASDYSFKGRGLCVRVDPPLIPVFMRLHNNFVHQYQYDQFFPADVQLPEGCPHPWFFNQQFICLCHGKQLLESMNANIRVVVPSLSTSAIHAAIVGNGVTRNNASYMNDCASKPMLDFYRILFMTRKYKYAVFTLDFSASDKF